MAMPLYLAMTAAETSANPMPENMAYMACHFASYGLGLSNLPTHLPSGSLLILNDRIPVWEHDPEIITQQLQELVAAFNCCGVLLDLQRPGNPKTALIAKTVVNQICCPVCVSEHYAKDLQCPVFLSAPAPNTPLQRHMDLWKGRELWLEAALETLEITVTAEGSDVVSVPYALPPEPCHTDVHLFCRYHIRLMEEQAVFTVTRNKDDLTSFLKNAEQLGIQRAVGLYQQLGK